MTKLSAYPRPAAVLRIVAAVRNDSAACDRYAPNPTRPARRISRAYPRPPCPRYAATAPPVIAMRATAEARAEVADRLDATAADCQIAKSSNDAGNEYLQTALKSVIESYNAEDIPMI
jgi:predicted lipid-binding transport protein (Tim44 family)